MSKELAGKRALVTGAASGIGRAVAIAFARARKPDAAAVAATR
jgi:NAD(P)-dependent dehydrogenase (short-subunit alcohol dehydrogenase family)